MNDALTSHPDTAPDVDAAARAARATTRRRRIRRVALFAATLGAALAVATPAMAWPMMGC